MVDIRANLADQLVNQVRFSETLRAMADAGVEAFVHIGPGDVTATMAKRTVKDATVLVVSELSDVAATADALTVQ